MLRWKFDNVVDRRGMMFGAMFDKDRKLQYVQEGRLGYEEYSARGFELWARLAGTALRLPLPSTDIGTGLVQAP